MISDLTAQGIQWLGLAGVIGFAVAWILAWLFFSHRLKRIAGPLHAEIDIKTASIQSLRYDLEQRDSALKDSRRHSHQLASELAERDASIEALTSHITHLSSKLELLETTENESTESINILEDELAEAQERHLKANEALSDLQQASHEALESLREENANVLENLRNREKTNQSLQDELTSLRLLHEQFVEETASARASQEHQRIELGSLADRVNEQRQTIEQRKEEISGLKASLSAWQGKLAPMQSTLARRDAEVKQLKLAAEESARTRVSLEKLLRDRESELHSANQRLAHDQKRVLDLEHALKQTHDEQSQIPLQRQRELSALREESVLGKNKLAEIEDRYQRQIKTAQQENAALAAEIDRLSEKLRTVNDHLVATDTKADRLSASLVHKGRELTDLAEHHQHIQAQLHEEIEVLKTTGNQAQAELTKRAVMLTALKNEFASLKDSNQSLKSQLAARTDQILQLERERSLGEMSKPTTGGVDDNRPANLFDRKPSETDDLTQIKGIGVKLTNMLNALGIYQIQQIANLTGAEVIWVDDHLETFKGRIVRDEWVKQAKNLCDLGQ